MLEFFEFILVEGKSDPFFGFVVVQVDFAGFDGSADQGVEAVFRPGRAARAGGFHGLVGLGGSGRQFVFEAFPEGFLEKQLQLVGKMLSGRGLDPAFLGLRALPGFEQQGALLGQGVFPRIEEEAFQTVCKFFLATFKKLPVQQYYSSAGSVSSITGAFSIRSINSLQSSR
ncbi:MAG: hypothetical protein IPG32_03495 [Saprospirales bacterium]|nr:hypothetical protein [Saprospirales bacterium]